MKLGSTLKDASPIKARWICGRHGAVRSLVSHPGRALTCSNLQEIDADPVACTADQRCVDPLSSEVCNAGLADRIWGRTVTKATSNPKMANETATFSSPPPKLASNVGDWSNPSKPVGINRSMNSPHDTLGALSEISAMRTANRRLASWPHEPRAELRPSRVLRRQRQIKPQRDQNTVCGSR